MKKFLPSICRGLLALATLLAVAFVGSWVGGYRQAMAATLSGCFLCIAIAAVGYPVLRKVTFTLWIVAGVTIGMSYPTWFIGIGDFRFTSLFVPLLQIIMFGMGTTLSVGDFTRVVRMPTAVLVGLICQFTIMPVLGYCLARGFGFPAEIAAGLVLVGVSPSGLASNVMTYIAKANLALSVTMTAASTLLAPIMTPLLMRLLGGQMIEIDVPGMMWSITKIVVIPVLGGLAFHHLFYRRFRWLDRAMPIVSMVGIFIMIILTVATGRDNILATGVLLFVACLLHCSAGFLLGYYLCRALRMDKLTCRTISLEVGLQNAGMASGIAAELKKVATLGLAPIIFGVVMNTVASIIANWWRIRPVDERTDAADSEQPETVLASAL